MPLRSGAESRLIINPIIIQWWFSNSFVESLRKLFAHFLEMLEAITGKNILFVKLQEWKYLTQLCKFLMTLSLTKVYYTMNNISVLMCSLESSTAELIQRHLEDRDEAFES